MPTRDPDFCSYPAKFPNVDTGKDCTNVFLKKGSAQETNPENSVNVSRSGNELDAEVIEPINVCEGVSKKNHVNHMEL